ncbi:MAG: hypothetical protein RHS_2353 [Robinsoniella sp. RHS]|nr:MAG: hypothetical protein RHS_2353 [Robinsoniella sp. RHS]
MEIENRILMEIMKAYWKIHYATSCILIYYIGSLSWFISFNLI